MSKAVSDSRLPSLFDQNGRSRRQKKSGTINCAIFHVLYVIVRGNCEFSIHKHLTLLYLILRSVLLAVFLIMFLQTIGVLYSFYNKILYSEHISL
jgi:hypothetical protein